MFCKDLFKLCYRCIYVFKVTGGICDSQPHFAFQHLTCGETLVQVLDLCCSVLVKRVNQIGMWFFGR